MRPVAEIRLAHDACLDARVGEALLPQLLFGHVALVRVCRVELAGANRGHIVACN